MLRVFTAQMGYKGPSAHDTTVKTKTSCFIPSWDIVLNHKNGSITDLQYTMEYMEILLESLRIQKDKWLSILKQKEIVLTCFCGRGKFCHRYLVAMFLEKFGARYLGEINVKTNGLIYKGKYLPEVLNQETIDYVKDYEIPAIFHEAKSDFSGMVVDPLTIQSLQSGTCRTCSDNRKAMAWTQNGTVQFGLLTKPGGIEESTNKLLPNWEEALGSKEQSCCTHKVVGGKVEYDCPMFKELVFGYKVGLTSQGANLNPCKHCVSHVDRGGKCFGDACPDGPFPIEPGAGIRRA